MKAIISFFQLTVNPMLSFFMFLLIFIKHFVFFHFLDSCYLLLFSFNTEDVSIFHYFTWIISETKQLLHSQVCRHKAS